MKILIIEDEHGITNFLQQGLQEEGYIVVTADNGNAGLEMAAQEKPDLILLDWMLPGTSGIDVCRQLRENGAGMPILFLTAKDTVQETIEGLRAGANDYIKKPFSFEELLERIKVQLRSAAVTEEVKLGHFVIYPSAHKVTKNGTEIYLTQREFELLHYLVKNRGRVCTRKDIINDVWDIHFDYDTSVIDVFMNTIRKKLGLTKDDELIKTVRGVGYIIEN